MNKIELKYGSTSIPFEYDESKFEVLGTLRASRSLTDAEIGERLDSPIDAPLVEEIVSKGQRVLLVVPDATRQTGAGQIVNLLVRRLIANGSSASDINIIFATGIHRAVTREEQEEIVTPFVAQRIKKLQHNANDAVRNFRVGETSSGIPVELNWMLTEFNHVVLVGAVTFHYFAGFTGGRKLICPGLASARTVQETHKLAFDCDSHERRQGVGTGLLDGNPVNEAFIEAASFAKPSFAINTIVDDLGRVTELYCGDWKTSHRRACEEYAASHTINVSKKRDLVIASCGGYPLDINMIQAHKALEAASQVCNEGGTILLLAECRDGLGRADFLDWFESSNSRELADRLCGSYQVNGQTSWSLLMKAERLDVRLISGLSAEATEKMRMTKAEGLESIDLDRDGYILPFGAKFRICCD